MSYYKKKINPPLWPHPNYFYHVSSDFFLSSRTAPHEGSLSVMALSDIYIFVRAFIQSYFFRWRLCFFLMGNNNTTTFRCGYVNF